MRRCALLLAAALALAATPACESFLGAPSKVAQGQLYESGDMRYDEYFRAVHDQQVAASGWGDARKEARRPLHSALAVTPDAAEDTVLSAARERAAKLGGGGATLDVSGPRVSATPGASADPPLFSAVEEAARAEIDRARKLRETADKLEELAKAGEGLRKQAEDDQKNMGADKADDKKVEKYSAAVTSSRSM